MTQKFSLYDDLTVTENLRFIGHIYALSQTEIKQRTAELLSLYGMNGLKNQLVGSLSGGQKQRVALAGATVHKPKILFLDEPTSAVDPENRRDFWESLFDLTDLGTTILVSTHYMDEAERCHRLAILNKGIKVADGAPTELINTLPQLVLEITGERLRQIKGQLDQDHRVLSVSQLGQTLRVSLPKTLTHSVAFLKQHLNLPDHINCELKAPNLEDVFVYTTRKVNHET